MSAQAYISSSDTIDESSSKTISYIFMCIPKHLTAIPPRRLLLFSFTGFGRWCSSLLIEYSRWSCIEDHITQVHVGGCHSSYHLLQKLLATSKTFNSHSTPPPSSFQLHWFRSLVQQSPDRVQSLELHRRPYNTGSCRWVPLELPLTPKTFGDIQNI